MSHSVSGRAVVVTGGSKGIGKGIARVFAQAGARVAILSRNRDEAAATAAEIGHGAIGVGGDVTDAASLTAAAEAVRVPSAASTCSAPMPASSRRRRSRR